MNDAIKAFSSRILIHLNQSDEKFHLTELCDIPLGRIKPEQIVSLTTDANQSSLKMISEYTEQLKEILSLTLIDLQMLESISQYGFYFSKLIRLSLRYNNEIGLNIMRNIFRYFPRTIRRFEIHCTRVLCPHYELEQQSLDTSTFNYDVKYFLLDLDQFPLISSDECYQQHETCFLMTMVEFVRCMPWLHVLHLIVNPYDLEKLMDMDQWENLFLYCYFLRKVKVEILGNVDDCQGKIIEWKNQWYERRPRARLIVK